MKLTLWLALLLLNAPIAHAYTVNKLPPVWVVESFSDYEVGSFPRRLRTYPTQRDAAVKVYQVAEEGGNRFLKAHDDKNISVQVMRQFPWDATRFPWARWRWRARILPAGADERPGQGGNDSACGLYILFGQYSGKALKYVWSTKAPVGTVYKKKPGKLHIIVLESGAGHLNQWQTVSLNIKEDYEKHFGEPLTKNPTGFGILTDGNAVQKPSACDYDDLTVAETKP